MRIRKHEKEKELGREKERLLEEDTNINQEGNMLKKPPIGIEPRNIIYGKRKELRRLKRQLNVMLMLTWKFPLNG